MGRDQVSLALNERKLTQPMLHALKELQGRKFNGESAPRIVLVSPIPFAIRFDTKGRLWVGDSPTWPHSLPGKQPMDSLVILEDKDLDGVADKHSVFLDKMKLIHGFELADGGGAFVAQVPNLILAKDTSGDGKADLDKALARKSREKIRRKSRSNSSKVHDLHATLLHLHLHLLLGFDHEQLTYRFQGRDFRLTDVHGKLVKEILA